MEKHIMSWLTYWDDFYREKIDEQKHIEVLAFLFVFAFVAFMVYRLNSPTPWVVDDLLKQQTARNIHNIQQLYKHAYNFYMGWGGRVWGEINAQLFLMIPKHIFDYINTFGYMLLLLLIQWNILGKMKMKPSLLIFIHFSLLLCLPAFGQDVLWISGTANYMWASLIPLVFFGMWRKYAVSPSNVFNLPLVECLVFIIGIFAGWANENVSVALIAISLGYMYIYRKEFGRIPHFAYVASIGLFLGSLVLWLAPGNFARFASEHHSRSVLHICKMVIKNVQAMFDPSTTLFLIIAFVILFFTLKNSKKMTALIFFIGSFLSAIAFSVIGGISNRVFFGPTVLMIIAVGMLYDQWDKNYDARRLRSLIAVLLLVGSVGFYMQARSGIKDYAVRWNDNIKIIQIEKEKGNKDIFVNPITPKNKFCATYGLDDIKPQKENKHWLNRGVARFFGIHTIQSIRVDEK